MSFRITEMRELTEGSDDVIVHALRVYRMWLDFRHAECFGMDLEHEAAAIEARQIAVDRALKDFGC